MAPHEGSRTHRLARAALFALLLVFAGALALYPRPPLVDWPEHLAQHAALAHQGDPGFPAAAYYQPAPGFVPYHGVRALHRALALALPWASERATGGLTWLAYLSLAPLACAAWLRRAGRDAWASLACFTVLVEANYLWGFAPHALGTALLLWGLVCCRDALAAPGREPLHDAAPRAPRGLALLGLGALGLALAATHAHQTGLLALSCGALALREAWAARQGPRGALAAALARGGAAGLALLPAVALTAYALASAGWVSGRALADAHARDGAVYWVSPLRKLAWLPLSSGLSALGPAGVACFLVALVALAAAAVATRDAPAPGPRRDGPTALLAALWLALTLCTPHELRGQSIAPRFASLALLAALWLAAPRATSSLVTRGRWRARALWSLAGALSLAHAHARFAQFAAHTRGLEGALALLEPGARVLPLSYELRPAGGPFALPVCMRLGAYAVSARGAMVAGGFTRTGVRYADALAAPELFVNDTFRPASEGLRVSLARYAPHYDYALVHVGPAYRGSPFAEPQAEAAGDDAARATRVYAHGGFELWRISHARP